MCGIADGCDAGQELMMVRDAGLAGEGPEPGSFAHVVLPAPSTVFGAIPSVPAQAELQTPPDPWVDPPRLSPTAYQMVFEESPVGIGLADEKGRFLAVNAALCALFGRDRDELIGRSSVPFTHPEDRADHGGAGDRIRAAEDRVGRVEKRYVRPDGTVRWAWLSFTHVSGPRGEVWTVAHMQDVTERKAAEQALQESESTLRAVAAVMERIRNGQDVRPSIIAAAMELSQAASTVLWELGDHDDLVVTAGTDASATGLSLPLTSEHPVVRSFRSLSPANVNQSPAAAPIFPRRAAGPVLASALIVPVTMQDRAVAVLQVGWPQPGTRRERSRPLEALAVLADQTAVAVHQARLVTDLQRLAGTDALTGLPNRRSWDLTVPVLMEEVGRSGQELVVALADLDRFKEFNDEFGHPAGDRLLRELSLRLRERLRRNDVIARWGGEEFAVAMLLDHRQNPWLALERLRTSVPGDTTSSMGFAVWDGHESAAELVERADRALYRAKAEGRDQLCAAVPPVAGHDAPLSGRRTTDLAASPLPDDDLREPPGEVGAGGSGDRSVAVDGSATDRGPVPDQRLP